jgi:hypothetical protein
MLRPLRFRRVSIRVIQGRCERRGVMGVDAGYRGMGTARCGFGIMVGG